MSSVKKLDKGIFGTLFFSIFAAVTGVGIVVPLLPVYAQHLGASGFYIGLIFGAFSLSRTLFLPYFGRLSDKKGRKPFIVPGLFAYAVVSIVFIFSKSVESLITIRFFQGIASAMLMPVIQAYVGDITPHGREGFTLGLFNMSMFLGLSLGPLIGGVINDRFNLQTAFISMGLLALVGFFLSLFFLPPVKSERVVRYRKKPASWKSMLLDAEVAGLLVFRFAYVLCIGIIWGFVPVLADTRLSLSSSAIGLLIMLGVLISGGINVPMGYVADRVNKKMMVTAGGLLAAGGVFLLGRAGSLEDMVSATIFFGLGGGISMPALMAMAVLKGSRAEAMGSVMALLTVAHSLGMLAGSLLGGVMMDLFQLQTAFQVGAGVMVVFTAVFLICTRAVQRSRSASKKIRCRQSPP